MRIVYGIFAIFACMVSIFIHLNKIKWRICIYDSWAHSMCYVRVDRIHRLSSRKVRIILLKPSWRGNMWWRIYSEPINELKSLYLYPIASARTIGTGFQNNGDALNYFNITGFPKPWQPNDSIGSIWSFRRVQPAGYLRSLRIRWIGENSRSRCQISANNYQSLHETCISYPWKNHSPSY